MSKVALRYAKALLDFARADESVDLIASDINQIIKAIDKDEEVKLFFSNKLIDTNSCIPIIESLRDELGLCEPIKNLLLLLIQNRRLYLFLSIAEAFFGLYEASHNILRGKVTSARPISIMKIEELKKTLGARFKKDIILESIVNEKILGGVIIDLGAYVFDGSFKTKLQSFKTLIKG